jgi:phosphoesterase RecJ-like protein
VAIELPADRAFELTILLDTADETLIPDGFPEPERRGKLVIIDHHRHYTEFGDLVIRREAAAVGEILFQLARELVWPIDEEIAGCLYTSIVADTGSFRYSSTSSQTHRVAAELIDAGAEPWQVATALYESFPYARQRLLGEVAGTLEISVGGKLATMSTDPEMLERCGANRSDLDGLVNLGRAIAGVEISALLRRQTDGKTKVSFRSKGKIDVGELAARFGGGGHRNAAGCTLESTDFAANLELIRTAVAQLLGEG